MKPLLNSIFWRFPLPLLMGTATMPSSPNLHRDWKDDILYLQWAFDKFITLQYHKTLINKIMKNNGNSFRCLMIIKKVYPDPYSMIHFYINHWISVLTMLLICFACLRTIDDEVGNKSLGNFNCRYISSSVVIYIS